MPINFSLILIILAVSVGVAGLIWLFQLLVVRVDVFSSWGKGPIMENSFLKFRSGSAAAEVKRISAPDDEAAGHVAVADGLAWVEINVGTNASGNARYKRVGYLDAEGYVYERKKGADPKRIGYLAKPSKPNEPTLDGERSFRELWLVKTLNVYLGDPGTVTEPEKKKSRKEKKAEKEAEKKAAAMEKEENEQNKAEQPQGPSVPQNDQPTAPSDTPQEQPEDPVAYGDLKVLDEQPFESFDAEKDLEASEPEPGTVTIIDDTPKNNYQEKPVRHSSEEDTSSIPLIEIIPEKKEEPVEPEVQSDPDTEVPAESEMSVQAIEEETPEQATQDLQGAQEERPFKQLEEDGTPAEDTVQTRTPATSSPVIVDAPALDDNVHEDEAEVRYLQSVLDNHSDIIAEIKENMVRVDGGSFNMGVEAADDGSQEPGYKIEQNESPVHKVTLDTFYIGKYPVTQRVWTAIMGYNPSEHQDDSFPVAPVKWTECDLFVTRLSKLTNLKFSLPTEAQWEFAARGGNLSENTIYAGSNDYSEVGWDNYAVPVGKKKPNELGIYDMSGLVREWTRDWFLPYTADEQFNPVISEMPEDPEMQRRAVRSPAGNCTVTNRKGEYPETLDYKSYGFRVVCENIPDQAVFVRKTPAVLVGQSRKRGVFGGKSAASGYSDEARGGVFAAFDHKYGKADYEEYVEDSPYGWLDTALASAFIFAAIYMVLYFFNSVMLQFPMYDPDHPVLSSNFLTLFYFVVWVIVRTIKVACAEAGNSIQPQLDLFNRSRGVLAFDILIIVFSLFWFDADFIPVARALLLGVVLNLISGKTRERWTVINPYVKREDGFEMDFSDDDADQRLVPPEGNDTVEYNWTLDPFDKSKSVSHDFTMRFDIDYLKKLRTDNPFHMEMPKYDYRKYVEKMRDYLLADDDATYHTRYLAQEIMYIAKKNGLSELDTAQFALDFVQKPNIDYVLDKDSTRIAKPMEYMRYPDETLYDKEGDCDCKSFLAYMLFHAMGFDVLFMLSSEYKHAAIGLCLKDASWKKVLNIPEERYPDIVCEVNGREYIYCETTNDKFKIGSMVGEESIVKYDKKIELLCDEDEE